MVTLKTWSFMLAYKLKRLSQSCLDLVFAQVSNGGDLTQLFFSNQDLGYTVSRAILSDAIALTRGDRFYTHDFTPYNLTAWGYADCQRDPKAFGFGSTMGKLLLRTLPEHYSENSVYTFFPFMTPDAMQTNLTKLGVLDQYDLNKPSLQQGSVSFSDYNDVVKILKSPADFDIPYRDHASRVIKGSGYVWRCFVLK
jgi:linoleate 10R-lipoxygenase